MFKTESQFDDLTSYIKLFYYIDDIAIKRYLIAYKYNVYRIKIQVDRNKINDPKNYSYLNSLIISKYCVKNLDIPISKPRIDSVKSISEREEQKLKKAILLKTFLPFRSSTINFIPDPDKTNEENEEEFTKQLKTRPLDKLTQFLDSNCPPEEKEYVIAETKGSALARLCTHPLIDSSKTYCNVFNEVLDLYGIEALRNLIDYDLTNVISISGHIDPLYIKHTADVLTAKGKNAFTSKGVSMQGTGPLSVITFDKVEENLKKSAQKGKKFSIHSTSTSILIGSAVPLGTGFATIQKIESKLGSRREIVESNADYFKQGDDDDDEIVRNFILVRGKFPKNHDLIEKYIKKSVGYYANIEVNRFKTAKMEKLNVSICKFITKFKNFKIEIKQDVYNYEPETMYVEINKIPKNERK